jgi:integrase
VGHWGLYLQVTAGAGRSWVCRYQLAGKRRDIGLSRSTRSAWLRRVTERRRRASSSWPGQTRSKPGGWSTWHRRSTRSGQCCSGNTPKHTSPHAALPYAEIATCRAELRQQKDVAPRALEFAILTCARTGEVIGARWDEINLAERLWIVPAERMKAGKKYRVPLSDAALAIIEKVAAIRSGDFVFPGASAERPMSNMAMMMLLRRMGRGDLLVHGFRSAFSDWCAEQTNFQSEVREMALARAVGEGGGGLLSRRPVCEAAPTCGGMGAVLHGRAQRRRVPMAAAGWTCLFWKSLLRWSGRTGPG